MSLRSKILLPLIGVTLLIAGCDGEEKAASAPPPPPEVTVP